jgi:hypothetical protein
MVRQFMAGLAVICAAADIIWIIHTAPSVWSGIWAAQEKWFDSFNVVHFVAEIIFISPALIAIYWRDRRREKVRATAKW